MDDSFSFTNFCTDQVYELATDIASEFENIVDRCGIEALSPVILKVIRALEYLEATVINLESSKKEVIDLKNQNQQLLTKNKISKTERMKLEQDLEELQESTDKEINHFKVTIMKLRDDNKRLHDNVKEQSPLSDYSSNLNEDLIERLQNAVSSLTVKLDEKNCKLQEMAENLIKLQSSIEELTNANKSLCGKVSQAEKKIHKLYKDESNLKEKISEQKAILKIMEQNLKEATQQRLDLEESLYASRSNTSNSPDEEIDLQPWLLPKHLPEKYETLMEREKELLLYRIKNLEDELSFARSETESFQNQYLQLKNVYNEQNSISRPYSIRQLFHFVLGVITPISGNFRCF